MPLSYSDTGSSPLEVVNVALSHLGQKPIQNLDDTTANTEPDIAEACQKLFPMSRDALLAMTDWSFASGWVQLVLVASTPAGRWAREYAFPTNTPRALVVWELEPREALFERAYDPVLDRDVLYTDSLGYYHSTLETSVLTARATFQRMDTTKWHPLAVQALTYKLAAELAIAVTAQAQKWQAMTQSMTYWITQATAKDGKQRYREAHISSGLLSVRHGGGTYGWR